MNIWTTRSVDIANQKNYLDLLYKIYPISPNLRRDLGDDDCKKVKFAFDHKDKTLLIKTLCSFDVFPIKDSYVAYLKRDPSAIERNPQTIDRLYGELCEMGYADIIDKCSAPKETNRQIGPMFKNWVDKGCIGTKIYNNPAEFLINEKENAVLNTSDAEMQKFAKEYLGYDRNKGLDFVARFNGTYILGEAKFITDFGGHQNAQFDDAIHTVNSKRVEGVHPEIKVINVAILDGVLYIKNKGKLYDTINRNNDNIILSALLLREFLYSL